MLAMLRHGETAWSADKRVQGHTDVPLSVAGQAAMSSRRLPVGFDRLRTVTSPLQRCIQTVQLLGHPQAAVEPRLIEMSWGQWEGRRLGELRSELGDAMTQNEARGFDFRPAQGESPREVLARVESWLAEVARSAVPTLAVCHRGVIRVVFARAMGWDMLGKPPARLDWNALQVFRLDGAGRPSVDRLNVALPARTDGACA